MARLSTRSIGAIGGAAVGLAAAGGVKLLGRRIRTTTDPQLDDPLEPPSTVVHHYLATHDGGSLHVVDTGTPPSSSPGAPVVLLHGVTLQWWVWSAVIRLLRPHHRVLAWDMRGHGRSTSGEDGTTLEATAADLELLIDELDLHGVVVVGHSMGGMTVGRLVADRHEFVHERLAGLVFLATSAAPASQAAIVGGLSAMIGMVSGVARMSVRRPRFAYPWSAGDLSAVLVSVAFGQRPTARMIEDVRSMEAEMSASAMADAAASIATHNIRRDLGQVDLPTQVVVGTHDKLTPPVHARELVALIRGAELMVLDGIGHQVMQECPEAVVDAVNRVTGSAAADGFPEAG